MKSRNKIRRLQFIRDFGMILCVIAIVLCFIIRWSDDTDETRYYVSYGYCFLAFEILIGQIFDRIIAKEEAKQNEDNPTDTTEQ